MEGGRGVPSYDHNLPVHEGSQVVFEVPEVGGHRDFQCLSMSLELFLQAETVNSSDEPVLIFPNSVCYS